MESTNILEIIFYETLRRYACCGHVYRSVCPYVIWNQLLNHRMYCFDVLLTVRLSIILVINQLNAQILVL